MTANLKCPTKSFDPGEQSIKVHKRILLSIATTLPILWLGLSDPAPLRQTLPLTLPAFQTSIQPTYRFINDRELDCLASNIYFESRNQPSIGQLAVGITTYIRSVEARWPDSICGVVHQPRQFSWVNDSKQSQHISTSDFSYLGALELASDILAGEYDNILPIFAPTHFHTTRVNPSWNKNLDRLAVINDHIFYQ